MADEKDETTDTGVGTDDTTEYSASRAPETRAQAEERDPSDVSDARLLPGGARGSDADPGMSSLDRNAVPSEAAPPRMTDFGVVDETSKID